MNEWRQSKWNEPLIYELGKSGRIGYLVPELEEEIKNNVRLSEVLPKELLRSSIPELPEVSEVEVLRHYTRLAETSYGVDHGPVPLGSCTMKYNPRIAEELALDERLTMLHPLQDDEDVQGLLEILYELEKWLAEITGMDRCSLQPPAGAAGELVGALMIRKYHELRGENRDEMLIPDNAHGTNPASAAMAGFKVVRLLTDERGNLDLEALKAVVGSRTAGIMLTNPNTLGLFEEHIMEIADIVHGVGGLLYYDGANLNGILGVVRPGDMGFDIVHLNLHKTFGTPHGGGGPGAGPVCAKGELVDLLPRPLIEYDGRKYYLDYKCDKCIGRIRAFNGNIIPLVKAYIYILSLGPQGLREVAEQSVLNTNYFISLMKDVKGYDLPYDPSRPRKHEVVYSAKPLTRDYGITAEDVAKNLLDHGLYAPTIYFPLIVEEALMIEFTDTETKENIEYYAKVLKDIAEKAKEDPSKLREAPVNTSVRRVNAVKANHPKYVTPTYRVLKLRREGKIKVL